MCAWPFLWPASAFGSVGLTCICADTIRQFASAERRRSLCSGGVSRFAPCLPLRSRRGAKARGRTEGEATTRSKETPGELASVW